MGPLQHASLLQTEPLPYWIAIEGPYSLEAMENFSFRKREDGVMLMQVHCAWHEAWHTLDALMERLQQSQGPNKTLLAAVISAEEEPDSAVVKSSLRPIADIRDITGSLWLGDALLADRVTCFLQPVQDKRGKVFGYEAFARTYLDNGKIIGGREIFIASRFLNLEFKLDRYLHQKAVEAFVASNAENRLFINFQSGFVQRPDVYLEGLNQVVKRYGIPERNIVLDLTQAESQRNLQHLRAICNYCRQQGYCISLDDITSLKSLEGLLHIIQPDFIKLDLHLTQQIADPKVQSVIGQMVDIAHQDGITVIAEGIESKEMHDWLFQADVDLFQGYHIGAPAPVEQSAATRAS